MKRIVIGLFLSIIVSGCLPTAITKSDNKAVEQGEFAKGEIVRGFPNVPRYPESLVIESIESGGSYGASFISKDSLDKVTTFYSDTLSALGWESQLVKNSESNYEIKIKNSQHEGTITINMAADGSQTAITYSISPR